MTIFVTLKDIIELVLAGLVLLLVGGFWLCLKVDNWLSERKRRRK